MKAHILTPIGAVFEGEVEGVQMPGVNGGFEVKKDHAPLVTLLDIGRIVVKTTDEKVLEFAVSGGFTEINENEITILAEEAIAAGEIDVDEEQKRKKEIEEELRKHRIDTAEHNAAEKALNKVKNRIRIATRA